MEDAYKFDWKQKKTPPWKKKIAHQKTVGIPYKTEKKGGSVRGDCFHPHGKGGTNFRVGRSPLLRGWKIFSQNFYFQTHRKMGKRPGGVGLFPDWGKKGAIS